MATSLFSLAGLAWSAAPALAHDPDDDDLAKVPILEPVQRGTDPAERFRQHRDQSLPFVGQGEAAWKPAEQLHPQKLLKALDLMADRRLRHAQLQSGTCEAELTG